MRPAPGAGFPVKCDAFDRAVKPSLRAIAARCRIGAQVRKDRQQFREG
jgi:hypothetical protein